MNNKEKQVVLALLKIAEKQQRIIKKLAQTVAENPSGELSTVTKPQTDPNVDFIMTAIPAAAVNAGINNVVVTKVDTNKSAPTGSGYMSQTYLAHIMANPGKRGDAFKQLWEKQLATQRPDLVGRVGFIFEG
jgi:hypothetical protein